MAEYWVIQEGFAGDVINALAHPGLTRVTWTVVEDSKSPGTGAKGPYVTQAQAQSEADTLNGTQDQTVVQQTADSALDYSLHASGLKDWFFRGLMVAGGLFLMAYGVAKLTNAENKLTEIASKIPVIPV